METICPYCNTSNRSSAKFCEQCGRLLEKQEKQEGSKPIGSAFDSAISPPSSESSAPELNNDQGKHRPSILPEQKLNQPETQFPQTETPTSAPVKPSGVAFESGSGAENGRPISMPEEDGRRTMGTAGPEFSAKGNQIIGEVRDFHERRETEANNTWIIWTFRIARYDRSGNQLQPIPVEMKGMKFEGAISEGDWVEVPGIWKTGTIVNPRWLTNLTTGSRVSGIIPFGTKIGIACGWIMFVVFIIAVIAFIIFIFSS